MHKRTRTPLHTCTQTRGCACTRTHAPHGHGPVVHLPSESSHGGRRRPALGAAGDAASCETEHVSPGLPAFAGGRFPLPVLRKPPGSPAHSHAARGAGLRPEAPGPGGGACVGLARAAAHGGGARRQPARWAPLAFFRPNPLNLPPGARALAAFRARLVCPRSGLTAGAGCPQASWPFSLSARTATRPQSASSRGRGRAPRTECPSAWSLAPAAAGSGEPWRGEYASGT